MSYTVVGRPAGAELKNVFGFALGAEWSWNISNQLFGEILANTAASATAEPAPGTVAVTPEAPGGEVSITAGIAHQFLPGLRGFLGLSADNNGAVLFPRGSPCGSAESAGVTRSPPRPFLDADILGVVSRFASPS